MTRRRLMAVFCSAVYFVAGSAQAEVYVCDSPNGSVTYTNVSASAKCRRLDLAVPNAAPLVSVPAPKGAKVISSAAERRALPSGSSAVRVDAAAQRTRDTDRRRILEDELSQEGRRLSDLQAEYAGGEPERRGDEKNYQRYLDRVQRLKDDISRTQGNIAALNRELSQLKD